MISKHLLGLIIVSILIGYNSAAQDLEEISRSVTRYEALFTDASDVYSLTLELQRLVPLVPEWVLGQILDSDSILTNSQAREAVQGWWRSQDPLPASRVNERMVEHVRRVQYAVANYPCAKCPTGYDERGGIYVRYGAPERITQIVFDDPRLIDAVYQPGVAVSPGDFPENEFWRYLNINQDAYFLFVQDQGRYREGITTDLLPSVLRSGLGYSGRGQVKSNMVLAVMRSIYRQLALEHTHFGARFNDIDIWLSAREETGRLQDRDIIENAKLIAGGRLVMEGERAESSDLPQDLEQPANIIAQNLIMSVQAEDKQAAYQREILLPPSTSDVLGSYPLLELGVHHARFLESDGTTRTEIYWHPAAGGFHDPENEYAIQVYALQEAPDYAPLHSITDVIRIQMPSAIPVATIPVQTMHMHGSQGLYHLALQWDQHEVTAAGIGDRVRVASLRIDSLYALDSGGLTLEMSDLTPLIYPRLGERSPWPHSWINRGMEFGLKFEIYHLTYDADDRTRYTVTYEVSAERGRTSSTRVEFEGAERTAQEEILLDLGQRTGEIVITVTVQDRVSGEEILRHTTLTVRDG